MTPHPVPTRERRREPRYAIAGAQVELRGRSCALLDISTLGAKAIGPHPGVRSGEVVPLALLLPRGAPERRPHRFALLALIVANDARGLVLRWSQPSARWARALSDYLAGRTSGPA
jgi:hypothetical protein